MSEEDIWSETEALLLRLQNEDPARFERRDVLGVAFEMSRAVEPAKKLIDLLRRIPVSSLRWFPPGEIQAIRNIAAQVDSLFHEISNFDPQRDRDPASTRLNFIDTLSQRYQQTFSSLLPYIAFANTIDINKSEVSLQLRKAVQDFEETTAEAFIAIEEQRKQADSIVKSIRDAAGEVGVSRQGQFFGNQAAEHSRSATNWLIAAAIVSVAAITYAYILFAMPFEARFQVNSTFQAVQLATAKVLATALLAYALAQCVRNYSAHRHNYVINKHRENALLTFKALADAGHSEEVRDTILGHASAAIYAPTDSGYVKSDDRGQSLMSSINLGQRAVTAAGGGTP